MGRQPDLAVRAIPNLVTFAIPSSDGIKLVNSGEAVEPAFNVSAHSQQSVAEEERHTND